jgi:Uma2 family endonuclease
MVMPVVVPRYTIQDLDSFPDDGYRYELLDGVLLVTPRPVPLHDRVVSRLFGVLHTYLPSGVANIFTGGAVEIEPNLHLEPDLLVVPSDQPAGGIDAETRWTSIRDWWLAVEVSGHGSKMYDRDYKTPAYISLGVREVWRVDLMEQCVYVTRPGQTIPKRQEGEFEWRAPGLEHALVTDVRSLFDV